MSLIGTLNGSADTTFTFDGRVPSLLLVDAVDADLVVDTISVSVGGRNYQEVTDQNVIQAMSKTFMNGLLGADVKVGQIIKIATGEIDIPPGQQCKVVLGNAGATTPNVYAFSQVQGGVMIETGQSSINDLANTIISDVDVLYFEDTNFSKAEITFKDGHVESDVTLVEIRSMWSQDFVSDADGKLANVNAIDFNASNIQSVKLFASGGTLPWYYLNIL